MPATPAPGAPGSSAGAPLSSQGMPGAFQPPPPVTSIAGVPGAVIATSMGVVGLGVPVGALAGAPPTVVMQTPRGNGGTPSNLVPYNFHGDIDGTLNAMRADGRRGRASTASAPKAAKAAAAEHKVGAAEELLAADDTTGKRKSPRAAAAAAATAAAIASASAEGLMPLDGVEGVAAAVAPAAKGRTKRKSEAGDGEGKARRKPRVSTGPDGCTKKEKPAKAPKAKGSKASRKSKGRTGEVTGTEVDDMYLGYGQEMAQDLSKLPSVTPLPNSSKRRRRVSAPLGGDLVGATPGGTQWGVLDGASMRAAPTPGRVHSNPDLASPSMAALVSVTAAASEMEEGQAGLADAGESNNAGFDSLGANPFFGMGGPPPSALRSHSATGWVAPSPMPQSALRRTNSWGHDPAPSPWTAAANSAAAAAAASANAHTKPPAGMPRITPVHGLGATPVHGLGVDADAGGGTPLNETPGWARAAYGVASSGLGRGGRGRNSGDFDVPNMAWSEMKSAMKGVSTGETPGLEAAALGLDGPGTPGLDGGAGSAVPLPDPTQNLLDDLGDDASPGRRSEPALDVGVAAKVAAKGGKGAEGNDEAVGIGDKEQPLPSSAIHGLSSPPRKPRGGGAGVPMVRSPLLGPTEGATDGDEEGLDGVGLSAAKAAAGAVWWGASPLGPGPLTAPLSAHCDASDSAYLHSSHAPPSALRGDAAASSGAASRRITIAAPDPKAGEDLLMAGVLLGLKIPTPTSSRKDDGTTPLAMHSSPPKDGALPSPAGSDDVAIHMTGLTPPGSAAPAADGLEARALSNEMDVEVGIGMSPGMAMSPELGLGAGLTPPGMPSQRL